MNQQVAKYIMLTGGLLLILGGLLYLFYDKLHWLGRLPGDIRIERDGFRFYFPITTMILLSLLLNLLIRLYRVLF